MQDQRIEDRQDEDRFSGIDFEKAVLELLLNERFLWSVDEIAREISGGPIEATDAIAGLAGAGLVHRFGEFVFPARAARHADRIAST
jgi:hypothetical protein